MMPLLFTSLFSGGAGGAPPPVRTFFQTYFEPAENSPFETGTGLTAQVASVNRRTFLSWDVPGEHADVEVLARITTDKPSAARMGIMLRGGGSAGSETGWFVQRARDDERFEIGRYDGGAYTLGQDSGAAQFVKPDARWVWIRARVQGSTISARIWADGVQDEPADWQLMVTDSAIPGPGRIGVFGFDANTHMFLDHLAVGVGGAVAPSPGDALGPDQYRLDPETTNVAADWTSRWGAPGTALARVTTEPTQILPHGWQGMWGSAGASTTVDLSSGAYVGFTLDGTANRAFVYAPMGRMADCDLIFIIWTSSTTGNQFRLLARAQDYDLAAPDRGYFLDFTGGAVELRKYDPTGAIATLDAQGVGWPASTWTNARLRLEGDLIRAKVWAGVFADEPADWMLSAQDSDFADGYVGIGLRTDTGSRFMDFFFAENLD
jgi:hypothetical protein